MSGAASSDSDQVRAADLRAGLCLATDLARGFPLEHGLHSTLVAMRLCERLAVDEETASRTYFGCLLFYIGCTADAEVAADIFDEGALKQYYDPVIFGSPAESLGGVVRGPAGSGGPAIQMAAIAVRRSPWKSVDRDTRAADPHSSGTPAVTNREGS